MEYKVDCKFNSSRIEVERYTQDENKKIRDVARKVINLEEKAVVDALIELGWTPPAPRGK